MQKCKTMTTNKKCIPFPLTWAVCN